MISSKPFVAILYLFLLQCCYAPFVKAAPILRSANVPVCTASCPTFEDELVSREGINLMQWAPFWWETKITLPMNAVVDIAISKTVQACNELCGFRRNLFIDEGEARLANIQFDFFFEDNASDIPTSDEISEALRLSPDRINALFEEMGLDGVVAFPGDNRSSKKGGKKNKGNKKGKSGKKGKQSKKKWNKASKKSGPDGLLGGPPPSGPPVCACSPSTYTFTLDFSLTCPPVDFTIQNPDPGIDATLCQISPFDLTTQFIGDLVPTAVKYVEIQEFGQDFDVLNSRNITSNGDSFEYTSIIMSERNDKIPKVISFNIMAVNSLGEPIAEYFTIAYSNDCQQYPSLVELEKTGWIHFTKFEAPSTAICPAAIVEPTEP